MNLTLKELVSEINSLRKALDDSKTEIDKVKVENSRLKKIVLKHSDIQRAHRLGRKRINLNSRPRPIIIRFVSFKKRNEFFFAKSKLRNLKQYKNAFISKDLTILKSRLLNYERM